MKKIKISQQNQAKRGMEAIIVQIMGLHIHQRQKIKVLISINHHFLEILQFSMANKHKITYL